MVVREEAFLDAFPDAAGDGAFAEVGRAFGEAEFLPIVTGEHQGGRILAEARLDGVGRLQFLGSLGRFDDPRRQVLVEFEVASVLPQELQVIRGEARPDDAPDGLGRRSAPAQAAEQVGFVLALGARRAGLEEGGGHAVLACFHANPFGGQGGGEDDRQVVLRGQRMGGEGGPLSIAPDIDLEGQVQGLVPVIHQV